MIVAGFLPNQGTKAHGMGYEIEKAPTLRGGAELYRAFCLCLTIRAADASDGTITSYHLR